VYLGRRLSTPIRSLPLPQSRAQLLSLNRQIRRARRRILPELRVVMRALVDRFERTLDTSTRHGLLALPSSTCGTLALARLWRRTEDIRLLLMELTGRAPELPRNTAHQLDVRRRPSWQTIIIVAVAILRLRSLIRRMNRGGQTRG